MTAYTGSLFVGHCTHSDLVDHFYHFMTNLQLRTDYLLNLGMDGPNVNKAFERDLINDLQKKGSKTFLSIGTCLLHTVNNTFGKGFESLDIDLDQFAIDLHFWSLDLSTDLRIHLRSCVRACVRHSIFSETAHWIFLIFGMKLLWDKSKKVTFLFCPKKFLIPLNPP